MQQTVPAGSVSPVMFVCHRYYADIIIGLLQDVALQAALHPYEELEASQFETPPPMYDNNIESTTTCLRGDLLQQRVYQAVVWFSSESVCSFVCPSVRPSVCSSVRPSVRPSVCPPACLPACLSLDVWMSLSVLQEHALLPTQLVGNNTCSCSSKFGMHGGPTPRLKVVLHVYLGFYHHLGFSGTLTATSQTSCSQKQQVTGVVCSIAQRSHLKKGTRQLPHVVGDLLAHTLSH